MQLGLPCQMLACFTLSLIYLLKQRKTWQYVSVTRVIYIVSRVYDRRVNYCKQHQLHTMHLNKNYTDSICQNFTQVSWMQYLAICQFVGRSVNPFFFCTRAIIRTFSGQEVVNFSRYLVEMCGKVPVAPNSGDVISVCEYDVTRWMTSRASNETPRTLFAQSKVPTFSTQDEKMFVPSHNALRRATGIGAKPFWGLLTGNLE
jgi:hypothetical protein